jgi:hypothetical protein
VWLNMIDSVGVPLWFEVALKIVGTQWTVIFQKPLVSRKPYELGQIYLKNTIRKFHKVSTE